MKKLLLIIITLLFICYLSTTVYAGDITWITEQYRAYAEAGHLNQGTWLMDEQFSPPVPVIAQQYFETPNGFSSSETRSEVADNYMSFDLIANANSGVQTWAEGDGNFHGIFTANMQFMKFDYNYAYLSPDNASDSAYIDLTVNDVTTGSIIWTQRIVSANNRTVSVPTQRLSFLTPVGHEIEVFLDVHTKLYSPANYDTYESASNSLDLSYSMTSVVPEPISSILFVVGGATLGFRQFRKKFRK